MFSFSCDYMQGAHESILKRLMAVNAEALSGYGTDPYSESARRRIQEALGVSEAEVFFLVGGTQSNRIVISSLLKPFEGVVSVTTGHVAVHEAGAVEGSGHKVLMIPAHSGKMALSDLKKFITDFDEDENHVHMVFPGMVYISFPTEYGTLYNKAELEALYAFCRKRGLPLYIDGSRLGYGLASKECDVTLPELAHLCDVITIGGTKVGALCGEAVVFTHGNAPAHFMTYAKREGAMLAKGWLTGLAFDTLFTDGLYLRISEHAIAMAERLKAILTHAGCTFYFDSPTNQQFVVVDEAFMKRLSGKIGFGFWEKLPDGRTVIRFATSWATTPEALDALEKVLSE